MKLSELKEQVDALTKLAKKKKVDPEVRMATLPKFPMDCSVNPRLRSSLAKDFPVQGKLHLVYFGELKEVGYLQPEVSQSLGW